MALNIAVKAGSTYTSIFVQGHGLVLREPTVVAFDGNDKRRIKAVGYEALSLLECKAPNTTIVRPVSEGIISDPDTVTVMIREFVNKLIPPTAILRPRIRATVGIPLGLTIDEREAYEEAFTQAGIYNVTLVPNIVLSAIGADLPVGTDNGILVANIGGGRTEAALISYGGIIKGCGISLGGALIDKALVEYVTGKYNIKIGVDSAMKIKEQIGSLYENDISSMSVTGMSTVSGVPEIVPVCALDVKDVATPYLIRVCELVKTIIKSCPVSVANDVINSGLTVTGGVCNLPGLNRLLLRELALPIRVTDKPEYTQIIGGGKLLSNDDLLNRLIVSGSV